MKKVTKSKKHTKAEHESKDVVPEEEASKKMGSEIDEIFAAKKRKRPEIAKKSEDENPAKVTAANSRALEKKKGKRSKSEQNSVAGGSCQRKRKTVDGMRIFTEEELRIGKPDAGGTALCPFDCDCCF